MGVDAVGRRDEIDRIAAVLARVASGAPGHVVELSGEAGAGKSTVMTAALGCAHAAGWHVLRAAPTAAEAAFPWTGLAQLIEGVRREQTDPAAAGFVANLDAAISGTRSGPVEPELVAFGLAGLLDSFRTQPAPVLVAVDDYHWLDPASAGALAYSLRGLPHRRSVVLLARRTGEALPFEPARLVPADQYTNLSIGGLSLASLREIIADATGSTFGRAELAQLHQRTGGNPLYAVELARMVLDGVPLDAAALPESLRATIGRRVAALPLETRRALGAAALTVHPTTDLLARALPGIDVVGVLAPAEEADVAHVRHASTGVHPIAFRHPLMAAAALDSLTSAERRNLHLALADAVDDPVERAGHLTAHLRQDTALAAQLEAAARDASARGAVDAAVDIARAAVAATPAIDGPLAALERRYLHAELALMAGRTGQLPVLMAELSAATTALPDDDSPTRRDLIERVALLETLAVTVTQGSAAGAASCSRALDVVADPHRRLRLQAHLFRTTQHRNVAEAAELAEKMFGEGTEHTGRNALLGVALLAMARVAAGDPVDADELVARADTSGLSDDDRGQYVSMLTEVHVWTDHPRTEELAQVALDRMERTGNRTVYLTELMYLSQHLTVRGAFARAEELMLRLQEYTGEFLEARQSRGNLALLRAAQGDAEAATRLVADVLAAPCGSRGPTEDLWVACSAGSVAHTLGQAHAADALLDAEQRAYELGIHAVRGLAVRRDLVEALVVANRIDEAAAALERLQRDANRNQVPTALADAAAAAGVMAATQGDFDAARSQFAQATEIQRAYDVRYELARTLLAAGSAARRAGSRNEARERLEEAHALFEAMGAGAWLRRCAQELQRIPGRRRATGTDLTPTERQIAELVAAGHTNAEIAATLFVTVSTVESNLTRTYRKLGIRSRTELARRINAAS